MDGQQAKAAEVQVSFMLSSYVVCWQPGILGETVLTQTSAGNDR